MEAVSPFEDPSGYEISWSCYVVLIASRKAKGPNMVA